MEKRKNGCIIIFLIVCIFVALGAGLFGGYKYYELKNNGDNKEESNQDVEDSLEIEEEIKVIDFINYSIDKSGIKNSCGQELWKETIKLPMLTSNKKGILEINNAIKEDMNYVIEAANRTEEEALKAESFFESSYGYIVIEDFIVMHISTFGGMYCGTRSQNDYYYNYDIKNDIYLTNNELLDLYNVSESDLKKRVKDVFDNSAYADNNEFHDRIINKLEQDDYQVFIDSSNELNLELKFTASDKFVCKSSNNGFLYDCLIKG